MKMKARESQRRVRQYTLRGVPVEVDALLRKTARSQCKSLNEVALEALRRGVGLEAEPRLHHDLDHIIGTWVEDPEFDKAIEEMRRIDPELWK